MKNFLLAILCCIYFQSNADHQLSRDTIANWQVYQGEEIWKQYNVYTALNDNLDTLTINEKLLSTTPYLQVNYNTCAILLDVNYSLAIYDDKGKVIASFKNESEPFAVFKIPIATLKQLNEEYKQEVLSIGIRGNDEESLSLFYLEF